MGAAHCHTRGDRLAARATARACHGRAVFRRSAGAGKSRSGNLGGGASRNGASLWPAAACAAGGRNSCRDRGKAAQGSRRGLGHLGDSGQAARFPGASLIEKRSATTGDHAMKRQGTREQENDASVRMERLLRQALPPIEDASGPEHDLWPAMLSKLDERPARVPWFDWALIGVLA